MELLDLYDEHMRPLGRTMARQDSCGPGEYVLGVGIWIFNRQNQVLLTKRSPAKSFAPNLWENTGGMAMAGETPEQAAVRELFEETGIRADPAQLRPLGTIRKEHFFGDAYYLRQEVDLGDVVLQEGETCDVKWADKAEFDRMAACGELAASVVENLADIRAAFDAAFGGE